MLNTSKKIAEIRKLLIKNKIDYYLIPHSDEYQNEFLPNYSKRLEWISNFTGSAGDVIVGIKEAYLFVDGRYTIQAQNEVNKGQYKIFNYNKLTPLNLLKLKKAKNVGFDGTFCLILKLNRIQNHGYNQFYLSVLNYKYYKPYPICLLFLNNLKLPSLFMFVTLDIGKLSLYFY